MNIDKIYYAMGFGLFWTLVLLAITIVCLVIWSYTLKKYSDADWFQYAVLRTSFDSDILREAYRVHSKKGNEIRIFWVLLFRRRNILNSHKNTKS